MQEGTTADFPSHRPGNRCENSEKPPEEDKQTRLRLRRDEQPTADNNMHTFSLHHSQRENDINSAQQFLDFFSPVDF